MNKLGKMLLTAAAATMATAAYAGPVVSGFDTNTVIACDDCYTSAITLPNIFNFFGTDYGTTYISNNGYVTFNSGQSNYTPQGLGAGYTGQPIIAAFYDDIDTRGTGTVTYGNGTFGGHAAFGATWNGVGFYYLGANPTNTFQLLLVDRSDTGTGNFDIVFNYDNVGWDSSNDTSSAAVGYNAGQGGADGTYYQLDGSLTHGAFVNGGPDALISGSNVGVAGRYEFTVRNGVVAPGSVPEPASWAMMLGGFGLVGAAMRGRKRILRAA